MKVNGKTLEEWDGFVHAKDVCDALAGNLVDEGYVSTAYCESSVTYVDGDNGICRYRGYRIEELAEESEFLEVAYLLLHGELPSRKQYALWTENVQRHSVVHENLLTYLKSFRYDAHPMGMFIAAVSALSTFHAEANPAIVNGDIYDGKGEVARRARNTQVFRLIGSLPTIVASIYRHRIGRPYNYPDASGSLSYTENLLYMLDKMSEPEYKPNPVLAKALDVLFIIHADHELNCSTAAMRHLASARVDPYTAVAGAASALYGPLHGGANEAVLRMLEEVGTVDKIDELLEGVKKKTRRLMGFGHRIYKNYDPRARILKRYAEKVFSVVGRDPLADVAFELERRALADEYFVSRKYGSLPRHSTPVPNTRFYLAVSLVVWLFMRPGSIQTSISTPVSSTEQWGSLLTSFLCCSHCHGQRDGWRIGGKLSTLTLLRSAQLISQGHCRYAGECSYLAQYCRSVQ
mmetsp:Transcript_2061/g.6151  ORF Transcript_2061/g.6151 Transcript_2061/m.6151 type:complete len:462 (-) Transcript_2061:1065-2450(-)